MAFAAVLARLNRLSCGARVALVALGYVAALAAAVLALIGYVSLTSGPDRDASSGMYAFADVLFFVLAFAAGSIVPTGLMLYFLRAFVTPWRVFASVGLGISATGLLAAANVAGWSSEYGVFSMLAVPRVFLAPLLAGLFVLVGMFSPGRVNRRWLYTAAAVECITSLYGFVHWFLPLLVP